MKLIADMKLIIVDENGSNSGSGLNPAPASNPAPAPDLNSSLNSKRSKSLEAGLQKVFKKTMALAVDDSDAADEDVSNDAGGANKVKRVLEGSSVELLLTGNAQIKKLNKKYRGENKSTDVLSFSPDQIVISVEKAREQADQLGQSLDEELKFLFVHGLLHLLGYDHKTCVEEEKMLKKAYKILKRE